jgi:hypothetical protein
VTILYDCTRPVKPARTFGLGILAARPHAFTVFSPADEAWLVQDNARRTELDHEVDAMFAESEAIARLEAGICC